MWFVRYWTVDKRLGRARFESEDLAEAFLRRVGQLKTGTIEQHAMRSGTHNKEQV